MVAFGLCGAGGVAGCNTQSLVPVDGGGAHGGPGPGTGNSGIGNRSGGSGGDTGTTGAAGSGGDTGTIGAGGDGGDIGTTGAGGDGGDIAPTGAGGITGAAGTVGITGAAGFITGAAGTVGITGAAGFTRPGGGGMAGHGPAGNVDAGGPPPVDASTTTPPGDAGACDCVLGADGVLRMSWNCFSTNYQNGAPMSEWCAGSGGPGGWVSSCGLEIFKLNRDDPTVPDDEWVYDATGTTVGQQIAETIPVFVCPSDPSLKAAVVAGGQFPPAGCAVESCSCGDAGAVNCPLTDAGPKTINPL